MHFFASFQRLSKHPFLHAGVRRSTGKGEGMPARDASKSSEFLGDLDELQKGEKDGEEEDAEGEEDEEGEEEEEEEVDGLEGKKKKHKKLEKKLKNLINNNNNNNFVNGSNNLISSSDNVVKSSNKIDHGSTELIESLTNDLPDSFACVAVPPTSTTSNSLSEAEGVGAEDENSSAFINSNSTLRPKKRLKLNLKKNFLMGTTSYISNFWEENVGHQASDMVFEAHNNGDVADKSKARRLVGSKKSVKMKKKLKLKEVLPTDGLNEDELTDVYEQDTASYVCKVCVWR